MSIRRRASKERIARLAAAVRAEHTVSGPDGQGLHWFFNPSGTGVGSETAEERDKNLSIRVALEVVETLGIEDAHEMDWHLWCDNGAEAMIEKIVERDFECRKAEAELAPIRALVSGVAATVR